MKKVLSVLLVALMLVTVFSVAVAAEYPSPSDRDYYTVEVIVEGGGGTAAADVVTVPKGDTTKIIAKPASGYEFAGWTIIGDYEFVEGDANSATIVIRPKGDVKVIAKFKGAGTAVDNRPTSPTTSAVDNTSAVIVIMAIVISFSAAAVVVAGRKHFSAK